MTTVDEPDALTRRIELLAAASVDEPEGEGAAVAALVGALRAEIASVRAEVSSLRAETGGVRSDLEGLGGRLTGSVAASRTETGTLVRRVAELSTRLDSVGGRVDDVRNGLPSLSRELREGLDQVPVRTISRFEELTAQLGETVAHRIDGVGSDLQTSLAASLERESLTARSTSAALEEIRGALESRMAVLEDALDGQTERLEALARDGASTTTASLAGLSSSVADLDRRIADEGRDSAELLVGRLRDVTETRLSELETTLFDRLSGVLRLRNDELSREMHSALETARSAAQQDREAVTALAATMGQALDGLGSVLDGSLTGLAGSVTAALTQGREQTSAELASMAERFGSTVNGMQADLLLRDEQVDSRIAGLQSAVETKLDQVRAQVATAITVIRSDVANEVETLAPRVDELALTTTAVNESLRSLRTDVVKTVEELRDRLVTVNTDTTEVLRGAMTETRSEVAEITRALREDLLDRIEVKYRTVAERLDAVAGTSVDLVARMGALTASVDRSADAGERRAAGVAAVDLVLSELNTTISGFRAEWPTRTYEVVEGAKAVAEGVVLEVRSEVQAQLERVRDELARAVGGVDEAATGLGAGTDKLSRAGTVLVEYLEQRDRLLEAERDSVLSGLLETLAAGLSTVDRAALAARVGEAAARRRDGRDAERYRKAVGKPVAPRIDDLPEAVRALAPQAPPPVAASPRRRASASAAPAEPARAAAKPATKAVPARAPARTATAKAPAAKAAPRRPSAKSPSAKAPSAKTPSAKTPSAKPAAAKPAPAKPAPAKPAAAKPAPAKAVPAKRAPAKRAPAKRAPAATTRSPAARTPAAKAPAARTPAARTPAARTPARTRTAKAPAARSQPARSSAARPTAARRSPMSDDAPVVRVPSAPAARVPTKPAALVRPPAPSTRRAAPPTSAPGPAPGDRRGRLDEMPRVPGPEVALDAAAPSPAWNARSGGTAARRQDQAETSWAGRAADAPDDDDDEDVGLRTLFRRRR